MDRKERIKQQIRSLTKELEVLEKTNNNLSKLTADPTYYKLAQQYDKELNTIDKYYLRLNLDLDIIIDIEKWGGFETGLDLDYDVQCDVEVKFNRTDDLKKLSHEDQEFIKNIIRENIYEIRYDINLDKILNNKNWKNIAKQFIQLAKKYNVTQKELFNYLSYS